MLDTEGGGLGACWSLRGCGGMLVIEGVWGLALAGAMAWRQ